MTTPRDDPKEFMLGMTIEEMRHEVSMRRAVIDEIGADPHAAMQTRGLSDAMAAMYAESDRVIMLDRQARVFMFEQELVLSDAREDRGLINGFVDPVLDAMFRLQL